MHVDEARGITVKVWHWFSVDHARTATMFSRKCGELEAAAAGVPGQGVRDEHKSYAVASLLSSVAFLEAAINELVAAAASHDQLANEHRLPDGERATLKAASELIGNNRMLERFQLVLLLLGKEPFDTGQDPYQSATLLTQVRNELVHFKPGWRYDTDLLKAPKLERGLINRRFSLNPFTSSGNPFFPDKCLGHGCTAWGWNAALTLADEFFARLDVTPMCERHRAHLKA